MGLTIAVLAFVGCGGGDSNERASRTQEPRLAAAEYARRVDRLCERLIKEVLPIQDRLRAALARGTEREQMAQAAAAFEEQLTAVTRFRRDVQAVPLPRVHTADARRFIEKTQAADGALAAGIDALRTGDKQRFQEAALRYAGLSQQSASIARDSELPFAICGAGT